MTRPTDRHAVDQLVVQHLPAALGLAQRLTHDADLAEDIVQEALCRVLRRWASYRGESAFRTWMLQIVVNVYRDRKRRHRTVQPLPPDGGISAVAEPDQQLVATELEQRIRATIDALPDRQREVAILRFGQGLDTHEVATILQTSEANVHTCVHLARKRIANAIGVEFARRT